MKRILFFLSLLLIIGGFAEMKAQIPETIELNGNEPTAKCKTWNDVLSYISGSQSNDITVRITSLMQGSYSQTGNAEFKGKKITLELVNNTTIDKLNLVCNESGTLMFTSVDKNKIIHLNDATIKTNNITSFEFDTETSFMRGKLEADHKSEWFTKVPVKFNESSIVLKGESFWTVDNPGSSITLNESEMDLEEGSLLDLATGSTLIMDNSTKFNLLGELKASFPSSLDVSPNTVFSINGRGKLNINGPFPGKLTLSDYTFKVSDTPIEADQIKIGEYNCVSFNNKSEWILGTYPLCIGEILDGDYNEIVVKIGNNTIPSSYYRIEYNTDASKTLSLVITQSMEEPKETYTVTLETSPGIDLLHFNPGKLVVEEGEKLLLQFMPENRSQTSPGALLLIDGIETPFKDFGGNYYHTYMLTIDHNYSIMIALKEYEVTLPKVKGCTLYPSVGTHRVAYGEPFRFGLLLPPYKSVYDITTYANGLELTPEYAESFHSYTPELRTDPSPVPIPEVEPMVLIYTLDKVVGPVNITVEDSNPVSNLQIASGNLQIATDNGQLTIDNYTGKAIDVAVYNGGGKLVAQRSVTKTTAISLPVGIYFMRAAGETRKIVVP